MNNLDKQYQSLLQDILDNGITKSDRTGTGTISIFGRQIRHKMSEGFPLLTTKKMPFKTMVTELLWFLRGDTNIKYLVDNGCHIWDGDAYKNYLKHTITGVENGLDRIKGHLDNCLVEFEGSYEHFTNPSFAYGFRPHTQEEFINKIKTDDAFAKQWGELGPIYGKQWRSWTKLEPNVGQSGVNKTYLFTDYNGLHTHYLTQIDQIANSINLLKTDPDSRRNRVNAWNVGELDQMVLPPCHTDFQFFTRELSLDKRYELAGIFGKEKLPGEPSYTEEQQHSLLDELVPKRAISLMFNMRSVDTFLGLPFNIASYGLLLEIIAKEVNMVPDELIGNLGDVHLYSNHVEQAKEQIGRELDIIERIDLASKTYGKLFDILDFGIPFTCTHENIDEYYPVPRRSREPYPLPQLQMNIFRSDTNTIIGDIEKWSHKDFEIINYKSHPSIKAPLSN
jgi:thymidylate synthase